MASVSSGVFKIRSRFYGKEIDLSKYIASFSRDKTIDGDSLGSFSCSVEVPVASGVNELLEAYVRDGDWGELKLVVNDVESHMEIVVQQCQDSTSYGAGDGSRRRIWTITGNDWSKALQSEVRLSSLFFGAKELTFDSSVDGSDEIQSVTKEVSWEHPRVPGFLDTKSRVRLMELITGSYSTTSGAVTVRAAPIFKKLLRLILWGTWVDSDTRRGSLLRKLDEEGWSRFGKPWSVIGVPWKLMQLPSQRSITPHSLMQNFGCMPFNEVFYDYSDDDRTKPAIVYRPRPFDRSKWKKLYTTRLDPSNITGHKLSRSGAERFDYWNPIASVVGLNGYDILWDYDEGKIPLVDRASLVRHGLRPAEPQDDFYPPFDAPSEPVKKWYRERIWRFRSWYYNNPEMLTGLVDLQPANPSIRVGSRVVLPIPYRFRTINGIIEAPEIEAYVVSVSDTFTTGFGDGSRESRMTIRVIRGQPPGGLPLPGVWDWRDTP